VVDGKRPREGSLPRDVEWMSGYNGTRQVLGN